MVNFLENLVIDVKQSIREGYYDVDFPTRKAKKSLKNAVLECSKASIIAEIKPSSPVLGPLKKDFDASNLALALAKGGAVGISVLTEPKHFGGSLKLLWDVKNAVDLPILMKDIIIDPIQVEAAERVGADAILLIKSIFDQNLTNISLHRMIALAHAMNLEVLLEFHKDDQLESSKENQTDLIGINNRDLRTLTIDLDVSKKFLRSIRSEGKVIVSESGIREPGEIRMLNKFGAGAFLVGTSIMLADDPEKKIRELVEAL
jgi:indole-3-glycerol phosphate synthase